MIRSNIKFFTLLKAVEHFRDKTCTLLLLNRECFHPFQYLLRIYWPPFPKHPPAMPKFNKTYYPHEKTNLEPIDHTAIYKRWKHS